MRCVPFRCSGTLLFEEGGETVTVASNQYCEMLENFLRPRLKEFDDSEDFWFLQDGATAHTARRSLGILREMFPSRLVSLRGDIGWPARSPDLTPCYFDVITSVGSGDIQEQS